MAKKKTGTDLVAATTTTTVAERRSAAAKKAAKTRAVNNIVKRGNEVNCGAVAHVNGVRGFNMVRAERGSKEHAAAAASLAGMAGEKAEMSPALQRKFAAMARAAAKANGGTISWGDDVQVSIG